MSYSRNKTAFLNFSDKMWTRPKSKRKLLYEEQKKEISTEPRGQQLKEIKKCLRDL